MKPDPATGEFDFTLMIVRHPDWKTSTCFTCDIRKDDVCKLGPQAIGVAGREKVLVDGGIKVVTKYSAACAQYEPRDKPTEGGV